MPIVGDDETVITDIDFGSKAVGLRVGVWNIGACDVGACDTGIFVGSTVGDAVIGPLLGRSVGLLVVGALDGAAVVGCSLGEFV